ncbi:uncharacterized protein LOC123566062 [Mercenaria mercenaria]|uniref:uncharacterized protein LOC123566062 n=1 Tax=Mercenaria mercenaria TaxID=6596 RepID=UPI00234E7EF7|nr:uncharacterized protein LOC123566062 [Mercenaria mercenaria]
MRASKIYISLKHGETVVKELHTQFKEGRNCDLEIRLNKKRLYVHKCLIDTFFIKAGAELEDDRFYMDLTHYTQPVVEALIGLVYTGNLCCSLDQVENVYKAATELGCVEAQTGCKTYLQENSIPTFTAPVAPASVDPFPSSFELPEEPDPHVIIKTEPVDDFGDINTATFDEPSKTEKDYRSTIAVPVSSHTLGVRQPAYQYTLDSSVGERNFQQNASYNISNAKLYPALPAPKSKKTSPNSKNIEYVFPKNTDNKLPIEAKAGTGKRKRGRPAKAVHLEKDIVDKIRSFSGQDLEKEKNPKVGIKLNRVIPDKHNFSTTTEELSVDKITEKAGNKGNLVEYKTKSGTVYYKYADPSSLSNDEFSVDSEEKDDVSYDKEYSKVKNAKSTASSGSSTNILDVSYSRNEARESSESEGQTVLERWMESVSTIVKVENEADQPTSAVEDEIEAQKNEQMFSLGLTKKVDKNSSYKEENVTEKSGKRRLRARKKVDYNRISAEQSDLDESSDYDPLEVVVVKKKFKSHTPVKGRNLKIDSESLVTIDPQRITNLGTKKPSEGSTTIAVRQDAKNIDYDSDSGAEGTAYFPPAGSVPHGVNSRYAQGTYMKVKYVTESIKDSRGNITVVTKPVPVRPRQFGIDERLMNRPAVYVCHPTAPVVKPVVRKPKLC